METKVCSKCPENGEQAIENFSNQLRGLYGKTSVCKKCKIKATMSKYVHHPRVKLSTKVCAGCNNEYALTEEYWYTKTTKAGSVINGYILKKDSVSYRHVCKKCNGTIKYEKQLKKRYKELGCTKENYKDAYLAAQSKTMRKYDYGDVNKVTPIMAAKAARINLSKSYIAMSMRMSVKNIPDILYELGKEAIQIHRQLKQLQS